MPGIQTAFEVQCLVNSNFSQGSKRDYSPWRIDTEDGGEETQTSQRLMLSIYTCVPQYYVTIQSSRSRKQYSFIVASSIMVDPKMFGGQWISGVHLDPYFP